MKTYLITGANGFIAKNLAVRLRATPETRVLTWSHTESRETLSAALSESDAVFHLAGVNRPQDPAEFDSGNRELTAFITGELLRRSDKPLLVLSSSAQASLENPYGESKRGAESAVRDYAKAGGRAVIFRLPGVFGKWSKPNYNTVVATFCHNIARDLPIAVSNPAHELSLVHVDWVVDAFLDTIAKPPVASECRDGEVTPVQRIALGDLAALIRGFKDSRVNLRLPALDERFVHNLYSTYLTFLPEDAFAYNLDKKSDPRGNLAEFVKSPHFGQIFVSRTKPGITRGNHYHHAKTEKFMVVEGSGVVRFRKIGGDEILEYPVSGEDYRVVDIPPGYTHSIENVGAGEMVTLFWASEIFDPARPDTYFEPVIR
jgi:UDP-2-acetamido-2,6-beta-L-arabino-hexul-4-ose reductase